MKPYERYKDSGVEWLGELPEHWELIPNKYIFHQKKIVVGKNSSNYNLLSLTLNGIIHRDLDNPQGKFPAEFDTYQEVAQKDFVFCHFDVEETPRTIGLSDFDGMITGAYTVYCADKEFNTKFLYYFYLNLDSNKRLKPLYKGLRNTIPKESFGLFKTFIPPFEEQQKIADFLDQKCEQIDRAIKQKEQIITLLNEGRQITIQRAVTRGLNPDVKLKDSGVEWIGEIPEHWELQRLKSFCDFVNRGTTPIYAEEGVKVVNQATFSKGYFDESDIRYSLNKTVDKRGVLKTNDVLVASTGGGVLGKVFLFKSGNSNDVYMADSHVTILRDSKNRFVPQYFYFYLSVHFKLINGVLAQGSTNQIELQRDWFCSMFFPYAPLSEQQQIASYLDTINKKIDTAISLKKQEIDKLKEYKATLINSAVTGKIKID